MILNDKMLAKLSEASRQLFSEEQERIIPERFGTEPDEFHEWSEQDIYEQIRHIVRDYPAERQYYNFGIGEKPGF
jgi:hypothetical protein